MDILCVPRFFKFMTQICYETIKHINFAIWSNLVTFFIIIFSQLVPIYKKRYLPQIVETIKHTINLSYIIFQNSKFWQFSKPMSKENLGYIKFWKYLTQILNTIVGKISMKSIIMGAFYVFRIFTNFEENYTMETNTLILLFDLLW